MPEAGDERPPTLSEAGLEPGASPGASSGSATAGGTGAVASNSEASVHRLDGHPDDLHGSDRRGDGDGGRGGAVLVVAGTHGNERNAVWLLRQWRLHPELLNRAGLELAFALGNPAAVDAGRRYLERDLNRSFQPALLNDPHNQQQEVRRARELLAQWGPEGLQPCPVVFDLHSTTAAMGNSLVVYGRRPADLALAAGLQGRLGLPVYLHEKDPHQSGYLVEQWPCGLVIEVGPVPQGVINARIGRQTQLALETALELLAEARSGSLRLPPELVVHRHLRSLDLPRNANGEACGLIHPCLQDRDWQPLRPGDSLFLSDAGLTMGWEPEPSDPPVVWPLFINEAAYEEKGIALSLSHREVWPVSDAWAPALAQHASGLRKY